MLSNTFKEALKKSGKPYYRIAWEAGITPNQLYKITAGIDHPGPEDLRIQKIADLLGLRHDECFVKDEEEAL